MRKIPDRTAQSFTEATITAFKLIPAGKRKSFTADHGKEFSMHRELSAKLGCKVYFADPHAPWQRGTNENCNGLIRQFFPKRTSFADVLNNVNSTDFLGENFFEKKFSQNPFQKALN